MARRNHRRRRPGPVLGVPGWQTEGPFRPPAPGAAGCAGNQTPSTHFVTGARASRVRHGDRKRRMFEFVLGFGLMCFSLRVI